MRIYLIGFMGCGKSSLGKRLARKLEYPFVDTDMEVEREAGLSVSEIFRQHGEEAFRQMERDALQRTTSFDKVVVATGGGAPCYLDNMAFMKEHGVSVYLRMSVQSLVYRLENARVKRPLLEGLEGDDLLREISDRLAEREKWYLQANCVIKGETAKPAHIVALVFGG